jgi:nucleotide-binding universal stress UspA family protein
MERLYKESAGPEVDASLHVLEGYATRDIVEFAGNNESDLIVIATHGRTGIKHLLLGSVAEKVVRMAPCPVFTVKGFGKSLTVGDGSSSPLPSKETAK